MKKILFAFVAMFGLMTIVSCSEDTIINNYDVTVEMHQVSLNTQELVTESSSPFGTKTTVQDYVHEFPTSYKAYFVSKENKGMYTVGQVVKVVDVVSGGNDIVVPKLNYDVIVTNYLKPNGNETQLNAWYMWNDYVNQLPKTSQSLILIGKAVINYSTATTGTVELVNHFASVQIRNNQWVTGTPMSYDTTMDYFTGNSDWYVLYIRSNDTNTKIPVSMPSYSGTHYTLKRPIQPNKDYRFTVNGDVEWTDGTGNFIVEVGDFEARYDEDVNILIP